MSVGAIGAEILGGGGGIHPPPWYTSLKHPMVLGVKIPRGFQKRVLMVNLVEKNTMRSLVIQIYIGTFLKWREAGSDDYL